VIHTVDDLPGRLELRTAVGRNILRELPAGEPTVLHSPCRDTVRDRRIERLFGITDQIHGEQAADSLVICPSGNLHISAPAKAKTVTRLRIAQHFANRRARVIFIEVGWLAKFRNRSKVMGRFPHECS